jgi:AmmeMemoRadiSam system protein A
MVPGVLYNPMLDSKSKEILKDIAKKSIEHGLLYNKPWIPSVEDLPKPLQEQKASFVTLTIQDQLRGCIGSIFAQNPLAVDVAENAFNAAFRDPRFSPLKKEEFPLIEIKISVLSPFEKINAKNLKELFSIIREYKDGIYLKSPDGRATFLPDVWEKVPSKEVFIQELYRKAHLPTDYPFNKIEWYRYTTESF